MGYNELWINEMSDVMFNSLVEEIEADGFDEPLLIVKNPDYVEGDGDKKPWRIVAGAHRFQAARVLGFESVACIVKEDWDEAQQKIKTVRRNMLHGEIDPEKLTKLVKELESDYGIPETDMAQVLGFLDEKELNELLAREAEEQTVVAKAVMSETKKEMEAIDNLSFVLNDVLSRYGSTVPQGFIFFMHKGELHLLVNMQERLKKVVEDMVHFLRGEKVEIEQFLGDAIVVELDKVRTKVEGALAESLEKELEEPQDAIDCAEEEQK